MASKKTLEHYLRQLRLIEEHREKWCEQNVRRHYRDLMKDLQEFLGVEYAQLAVDDKLTYEILHGKAQYARFIEEVERRTDYFSRQAAEEIRTTVQVTYKKAFEGMVDAVEKSENYEQLKLNLKGLRAVTPDIIKNAVKNTFVEDALEKNHKTVIYDIKQQIGIGLSQGDRMTTMAHRISEQLGKDYKKAVQIVRTECHRIREAGYQDSSERISQTLKDNDSDYVLVKTWKTMQDLSVRPYRKKGKKGFVKGKGPDHTKMHGVTILVDELFDLGNGVKAKAPGQSGVAGHDINCRCYLSRDLMLRSEYEKMSGKKLEDYDPAKKYELKEQELLDNKTKFEAQKEKLEQRKSNLESYQYDNLWKETVTPADYAAKKDRIDVKQAYFEEQIYDAKHRMGKYANYSDADLDMIIKKNEDLIQKLKEFEAQGKAYLKIMDDLDDVSKKLAGMDDQIKAVRQKIMKAKGIDLDKMQEEIDSLIDEINKLQAPTKSFNDVKLESYMYNGTHGDIDILQYLNDLDIKDAVDEAFEYYKAKYQKYIAKDPDYDGVFAKKYKAIENFLDDVEKSKKFDYSKLYNFDLGYDFTGKDYFTDPDAKLDITEAFNNFKKMKKSTMDPEDKEAYDQLKKFFKEIDKIEGKSDNTAKVKKLQTKLAEKQEELEKIRKRYGLVDDAFSQARKDAAYWFTDKNGGAEAADKVLREKCGEIWRNASAAQKKTAYEYTQSYHKYNEPLRGIEYGTNQFKGVGNVDLEMIGVNGYGGYKKGEVKKLIDDLTDVIDKSTYDFDYWLQRGCRYDGMDKFFSVGARDFYDLTEKQMQDKLLGTTPTEYAFMSTGVAKGRGLNTSGHGITLNIYAPKGTKMLYCEPFSAFGNGAGRSWDGKSKQSSIGYEAEILMQRNTQFRVIKVEKSGSRWFIDMEVISQKR